jgi:hypothetical protein
LNDVRLNVPLQSSYFWDPDVIAVEPQVNDIAQADTAINRSYTGLLRAEGPGSRAQGRYLVWSDIANNRQTRWSEDDGRVEQQQWQNLDCQGRQLSCEHRTRRVARHEHDGTVSVLAESYQAKRLHPPNDVVAHRAAREIEVPTWPTNLRRLKRLSALRRCQSTRLSFRGGSRAHDARARKGPTSILPADPNVRYRMNQQAVFFVDFTS